MCIGQCGIQLGREFVLKQQARAEKDISSEPIILVDSENKVIRQACDSLGFYEKSSGLLEARNVISSSRGGCGNNWAMGYMMGREPFREEGTFSSCWTLGERILESVRRSVETQDAQGMTMLFHSLGGGTGSGLGSLLLELHRDQYPTTYLHSVAVLPDASGESPLQSYNSLLSLSTIHERADSCLLLYNDGGLSTDSSCAGAHSQRNQAYSIHDVNAKFTSSIYGLCSPASPLCDTKLSTSHIQGILAHLSPDTNHKFFSIHQVSSKTISPVHLLKQLVTQRLYGRDSLITYSAALVTRGTSSTDRMYSLIRDQINRLSYTQPANKSAYLLHSDNSFPCDGRISVTLGLNSSLESELFQRVIAKSTALLSHRAYLHWYERYGVREEMFLQSLEILNELNAHYS